MSNHPPSTPVMPSAGDPSGAVRVLHVFFRIASITFLLVTFSFSGDESGRIWIMWRDETLLAVTLTILSLVMGVGWRLTERRIRKAKEEKTDSFAIPRKKAGEHPYNIWKEMDAATRGRLAVAVFFTFATIGPLVTLMASPLEPVRPLQILIVTVASGALASSFILLGRRPILLVIAIVGFICAQHYAGQIVTLFEGRQTRETPHAGVTSAALPEERLEDLRAQRTLLGLVAIVLIATGYLMFIVLLSGEGRQRVRLLAEVTIARRIQETLLPSGRLKASTCDVSGATVPATEVGGDYYDFVELPDGRVVAVIADVAGHGVGAGILSAMTKSAFRSQIAHDPSPAMLLTRLNNTLCELVEKKMFVTMACILIDGRAGTARIATAGHPPVLHVRRGETTFNELRTPSLGLGMNAAGVFSEVVIPVKGGDVFLLYTDGVLEGVSPVGEQFGDAKMQSVLAEMAGSRSEFLPSDLLDRLTQFTGAKAPRDDATVVTVRINDSENRT